MNFVALIGKSLILSFKFFFTTFTAERIKIFVTVKRIAHVIELADVYVFRRLDYYRYVYTLRARDTTKHMYSLARDIYFYHKYFAFGFVAKLFSRELKYYFILDLFSKTENRSIIGMETFLGNFIKIDIFQTNNRRKRLLLISNQKRNKAFKSQAR